MDIIEAAVCWGCVVGLHEECMDPQLTDTENPEEVWVKCCCYSAKVPDAQAFVNGVGRPVAEPSEITDIKSTGRKRAAMLYPILNGMLCEWAGLARAGGGKHPIVGCEWHVLEGPGKTGVNGDVHHSPDKNTLNNSPGTLGGNAHRICKSCHHTWHAQNDEFYGKNRPEADEPWLAQDGVEHDPFTEAEPDELESVNAKRKGANQRGSAEQIERLRQQRADARSSLFGGERSRSDADAGGPKPSDFLKGT